MTPTPSLRFLTIGLITHDDETSYRETVRDLTVWCQENNLSLNISKTKELIVDYRKRRAEQAPIHMDRAVVEQVERFLGVHITKELFLATYINTFFKRAQQCLFPLRRLKRFSMGPHILKKLYSCTIESILIGCITT